MSDFLRFLVGASVFLVGLLVLSAARALWAWWRQLGRAR
jgi:hypothetical protein